MNLVMVHSLHMTIRTLYDFFFLKEQAKYS